MNKITPKWWIIFIVLSFTTDLLANHHSFVLDKSHSRVRFESIHLLVSEVDGRFQDFDFEIDFEKNSIKGFSGMVQVKSIDTDNEKRDRHLRSSDFFEVDQYPTITLEDTSYQKEGERSGILTGDLTIKGVKQTTTFKTTHSEIIKSRGDQVIGIKLVAQIQRMDFNLGEDYSNAVIGDQVKIIINLEFRK